ncbi:hypothetical protein [Nocardia sp. NPDC049149]
MPGSIGYHILPGLRRADLFESVHQQGDVGEWWRLTAVENPSP